MTDLKPCPFCGGEPVGVVRGALDWVRCSSPVCGAAAKITNTPESAAAAWNTRAPCPECDRQRERANEAVSRAEFQRAQLDRRFSLQADLARLLGCEGLEGDEQLRVAVERAKTLEAVAEAARRDNIDLLNDGFSALYYTTPALAALDANTAPDGEKETPNE